VQVRDLESRDIEDVYQVLSTNGWAHRVPDVEYLRRIVEASQRSCVAIEGGKVVGFARAITDGLSNGYLSMVVVAEPHRRQGVGKALVKRIVDSDAQITWVLRAGRDGAREFFTALGFSASSDAMERLRR
jgi:ribosomal protein S18 acetylase RimI-like enzyme